MLMRVTWTNSGVLLFSRESTMSGCQPAPLVQPGCLGVSPLGVADERTPKKTTSSSSCH